MRNAIYIFIALIVSTSAFAESRSLRTPYEGVRPLGMGNAFIALADDQNALFYNPAALAWVKKPHFNMVDLVLGIDSLDTLGRMNKAFFNGQYEQLIRLDTEFMRVAFKPTFIMPYFGISIYDNMQGFFDLRELTQGMIDVNAFNDIGAIAGFAIPVGKSFALGLAVKGIVRSSIDAYLTPEDLLAELDISQPDFENAAFTALRRRAGVGWGLGVNLGMLMKVPFDSKKGPFFQLGATIEDFFDTNFRALGTTTAPSPLRMSYNLGTAVIYPMGKDSQLNLALDLRNNFEPIPYFKVVHIGLEFRKKAFGIRGGLYQAQPTFGVSIETPPHTKIHFSSYAVEQSNSMWTTPYRFWLMQVVIGFNPV